MPRKVLCVTRLFVPVLLLGCGTAGGPATSPPVSPAPTRTTASGGGESFNVKLETTKGDVIIEVHPDWAPLGAARFRELVELGFYDGCAFFRVMDGFMAQTGINGDPKLHAQWADNTIQDEPVLQSNKRGYVTFAKKGLPNTRSTQFFINFGDNSGLDGMGFAPFGRVTAGMDVVDSLYSGYGDGPPDGRGPDQFRISNEGNAYLKAEFSKLDSITRATIVAEELP